MGENPPHPNPRGQPYNRTFRWPPTAGEMAAAQIFTNEARTYYVWRCEEPFTYLVGQDPYDSEPAYLAWGTTEQAYTTFTFSQVEAQLGDQTTPNTP